MNLAKDDAKKLIVKRPVMAACDDTTYEMYMKTKIATGLKAAEDGRIVSHDEAKKRLLSK